MQQRLVSVGALGLLVSAALLAANVHFVRGPDVTDNGVTLTVSGKLAGLGEGDITVIVNATGVASVECTNPGGNVAPGQDTTFAASGSVTLPASKNGNLVFSVTTAVPVIPSSACPNPQWTADATDVVFANGTVTVVQGGQVVLTQAF
jgi:hypothetical protein